MRGMMRLALLGVPGAQGGASSLLPFSDDFNRADGDLGGDWIYTPGVWTISGGKVTVQGQTLGAEELSNGDMETGDPPTGWTATNGATLSSVADERTGGSGSASLNVARGTSNDVANQRPNIVTNRFYRVYGWARQVDEGSAPYISTGGGMINGMHNATLGHTDWTEMRCLSYENYNYPFFRMWMGGTATTGQNARWDDLSLKPYTTAELFALRDFGTPNVRASVGVTGLEGAGIALCVDNPAAPANYALALVTKYGADRLVRVLQFVAGVMSSFGFIVITDKYAAGKKITLEHAGGVVRAFYDGVQVGTDYALNAALVENTYHGMFSVDETGTLDNFTIEAATPQLLNGSASSVFSIVTAGANLWTTSGTDDWLGRPVLVDLGDKWASIYRSAPDHTTGGKFHIRFSDDEGASWSNEDKTLADAAVTGAPFIAHAGSTNCGDAIAFVAPNGDLIVHVAETGATGGTYQYRSEDGGATFADEGKINDDSTLYGGQDYTVVGTDVYITMLATVEGNWVARVYKSSDNCATWALHGTVEDTVIANECGIEWLGGTNMIVMMREWGVEDATYQYLSSDLGATWGARTTLLEMGVFQKPRLFVPSFGGVIMIGRQGRMTDGPTNLGVWYLPPGGTWCRKFYPDTQAWGDGNYGAALEKADGNFYWQSYGGASTGAAAIRRGVFGITV